MSGAIVIIGAGLAALTVAETLRSAGHTGPITMLGAEPHAPYHRPPLSKGFLSGSVADTALPMRTAAALENKAITLRVDTRAASIDRAAGRLLLADGTHLPYDGLALCTGASVRPLSLPGAGLAGVHQLRTLDDALAIRAALPGLREAVVIGGGFIGLEAAAVLRKLELAVTVLEAGERLMARSVSPAMSQYMLDAHRSRGANVLTGTQVSHIEADQERAAAVHGSDGRRYPAGLVLAATGVLPNTDLAQGCSLEVQGGIVVDACGRTSDPRIAAAGDCTVRRMADGSLRRLESVQNAVEQGRSAAAALLGQSRPVTAVPFFYSDQYDIKLQMAGRYADSDRCEVRGATSDHRFSIVHYRGDTLVGVESVNQPAEHMALRKQLLPDQA